MTHWRSSPSVCVAGQKSEFYSLQVVRRRSQSSMEAARVYIWCSKGQSSAVYKWWVEGHNPAMCMMGRGCLSSQVLKGQDSTMYLCRLRVAVSSEGGVSEWAPHHCPRWWSLILPQPLASPVTHGFLSVPSETLGVIGAVLGGDGNF